jgi:hypothetical protein
VVCGTICSVACFQWVVLQVVQPDGEVLITNDGATILQKMTVQHPAAKMLVDLSRSQVQDQTFAVENKWFMFSTSSGPDADQK